MVLSEGIIIYLCIEFKKYVAFVRITDILKNTNSLISNVQIQIFLFYFSLAENNFPRHLTRLKFRILLFDAL